MDMTLYGLFAFIATLVGWLGFRKNGFYNPAPILPQVEKTPDTPPVVVNTPPEPKSSPTVASLAEAIKEYEGWILPGGKDWSGKVYPKGSNSYQCNNPGNCRYSDVGYAVAYGNVRRSANNFAIFETYALGWLYLNNLLRSISRRYPHLTLEQFIGGAGSWGGYSPASDGNDVKAYAKFLINKLGVDEHFTIGEIMYA